LSLTKFLILTDGDIDVEDFAKLWCHVLARVDWQKDLFIFANVSQDTLDYTGPSVNKGSKAMLMGLGKKPRRDLPEIFNYSLPDSLSQPNVFLPGTLVVQGPGYEAEPELAKQAAKWQGFADWPVVILVDDSHAATINMQEFLWTFFTRFEPAADICGSKQAVVRYHVGLRPPIIFDCRMKPWYTDVLEVDPATKQKVDAKIHKIVPRKWR
jgi:3-polyprenyl-4-hydroxybenzoate decarboxylase